MGYEVEFVFHEKKDDGTFNTEDESFSLKEVGKPQDDISPEKLAAVIMKEFSRRDVYVVNARIRQYIKKDVTFKETKGGGVMIGGKRYNLGLREMLDLSQDFEEKQVQPPQQIVMPQQPVQQPYYPQPPMPPQQIVMPQQPMPQMPQQPKIYPHEQMYGRQQNQQIPFNENGQRTYANTTQEAYGVNPTDQGQYQARPDLHPQGMPQQNQQTQRKLGATQYLSRVEILDPPPELVRELSPYRVTIGNRYQIINEMQAPGGLTAGFIYKIKDDAGKEVLLRSHFFRPETPGLLVTESRLAPDGTLRDFNSLENVDQSRTRVPQPRLLYDNYGGGGGYQNSGTGNAQFDSQQNRLDEALTRRRGLR